MFFLLKSPSSPNPEGLGLGFGKMEARRWEMGTLRRRTVTVTAILEGSVLPKLGSFRFAYKGRGEETDHGYLGPPVGWGPLPCDDRVRTRQLEFCGRKIFCRRFLRKPFFFPHPNFFFPHIHDQNHVFFFFSNGDPNQRISAINHTLTVRS